jgi:hypothetical protein
MILHDTNVILNMILMLCLNLRLRFTAFDNRAIGQVLGRQVFLGTIATPEP